MVGLKPVFCESFYKGRGVGWGMGGVFSLGGGGAGTGLKKTIL